ncbi:regulatory LuxR family protein [Saccharothrix carnea]|uniref:Regulatory LuxR family protein n=1 Tax=Saccharothrix carnea TaxID=1280637 RepID=A0A2P8HXR4_SACCR|nr:LuxR family transcriptional regulator [Saccharothrix carnea]PSL51022.1 regulatory LuxR family protein [Saccharothrix carnea]
MSKLYGRDREWASVLRFLSAPGGLLAIDGPPCSGKTSLLRGAVTAAHDRGYSVVPVSGRRLAASVDVIEALDRVEIDRVPVLIAVDQAHEDPAALLELPARAGHPLVSVLVALCGESAGADVREALSGHGEVLRLGPLDDDAVERMVTDLLDATPHPDLATFTAGAGGNPRLVAELIAGLREEGRLDVVGGVARPRGGWLPRRVGAVVRRQVDAMSAKATQVLRVAAVIGRSFLLQDVAAMMNETTGALLLAVDEVLASGLVVCVDERLEFGSDLVWRAVVDSMPGSVRHALRHDAEVLRTRPVADGVDEVGVDQAGADEAAEGAVGEGDASKGAVAVSGVRSLAANGRLGAAIALARESLAGGVPAGAAAELHVVLAGILLADGRPADAASELEHVLATSGVPAPWRRLAQAGRLLSLYFATGSRAGAHALSVLTTRDREPGDADVVMAATVHSCLEWNAGRLAEGMYWGRESTRWELDRPTSWWQSQSAVSFALKLSALGEFEQAERLVRDGVACDDEAVTAGSPTARTIARARVLVQAGKLAQALATARRGASTARDRGLRILVPLASTVLATVALHRGEIAAAAEHVRRYRADLAAGEAVLHSGQYDWVELLLAHAQGGAQRVVELARERVADPGVARRMLIEEPGAASWLVRQALVAGDGGLAGEVVGAAETLAADNPGFEAVSVAAGHARALFERDVERLQAVAGRHRHPWAQANANEDLAGLLREAGEAGRASAHTTEASRIFERMGAEGELARLRGVGGVGGGAGEVEWGLLSEAERDIARLVGAGLTNRQVARQLFLSPHTVNYHLRGIFKKLGISSRVELARFAHEHEHEHEQEVAGVAEAAGTSSV